MTTEVSQYTAKPAATTEATEHVAGGEAQRFATGANIPGDWWTLFRSAPLNELIEQSLANNHDLKAAQAALSVARENVLAQRGSYYPNVSGSFSADHFTPGRHHRVATAHDGGPQANEAEGIVAHDGAVARAPEQVGNFQGARLRPD